MLKILTFDVLNMIAKTHSKILKLKKN